MASLAYIPFALAPLVDPGRWDYHDFRLFYDAAAAFARGEDPYAVSVELGRFRLGYLYAPVTLPLFVPFTAVVRGRLHRLPVAETGGPAALVVLWYRILPGTTGAWFLPFCLLSFNSAIYIDIEVGNIEVFLQLLLWTGFGVVRGGTLPGVRFPGARGRAVQAHTPAAPGVAGAGAEAA
ncbi:MAG: hypothetical protein M5U09_08745 [Gammaproteobacteria bacterium]|nr:hypothetical protein [Gammaproteobacteria bacterium]